MVKVDFEASSGYPHKVFPSHNLFLGHPCGRPLQPIPAYSSLFQHIPAYSSPFQPIRSLSLSGRRRIDTAETHGRDRTKHLLMEIWASKWLLYLSLGHLIYYFREFF